MKVRETIYISSFSNENGSVLEQWGYKNENGVLG